MMISNVQYKDAFVWVWLSNKIEPVVAGKLTVDGGNLNFNYGKSYLARSDAISIYGHELPLKAGLQIPKTGLSMPSCIRDGAPDAWGRRVIINRKLGGGANTNDIEFDELVYLLESSSDRIGSLDFQQSATEYTARSPNNASLEELLEASKLVEEGVPLTAELEQALQHGTAIGGARPKALIQDEHTKYVAKFSSSTDVYSVVKAEFIAMRLAKIAGLNVAEVLLKKTSGKDVLLIERFDRKKRSDGWTRKAMVSALTMLGLDEMHAAYASYEDLAEIIRHDFIDAKATLKELYSRIVFNILCGNTDDHARNHAAFWDGKMLSLTPAYDICPQSRSGGEATQAMLISGKNRFSKISTSLEAAPTFLLSAKEASEIACHQEHIIRNHWDSVCEEAKLTITDKQLFWGRQFLNPYAFQA
jgi:serine/threonine-protein kinase HipA